MNDANQGNDSLKSSEYTPYRVHLPGFIINEEIGLGDAIKRATFYFGLKPCSGCEQRAAALNRWIVFTKEAS